MQIIKNREIVDDVWRHVAGDDPVDDGGDVIVTLARWQAGRDALLARDGRLGVALAADEPPELIAGDLAHFDLIALDFPVFRDGRAFTAARKLRGQYGYEGEIRAVGDVLRDQLLFMHRCGFDAMELRHGHDPADAVKAFTEFSVAYQDAVGEPLPRYRRR